MSSNKWEVNDSMRTMVEKYNSTVEASGKDTKTTRFVIGTSTNGWTEADCDYLCDGVSDDVEIQAAIDALPIGGGAVLLLDGTYNLSANITLKSRTTIQGGGKWTTKLTSELEGITITSSGYVVYCVLKDFNLYNVKVYIPNSGTYRILFENLYISLGSIRFVGEGFIIRNCEITTQSEDPAVHMNGIMAVQGVHCEFYNSKLRSNSEILYVNSATEYIMSQCDVGDIKLPQYSRIDGSTINGNLTFNSAYSTAVGNFISGDVILTDYALTSSLIGNRIHGNIEIAKASRRHSLMSNRVLGTITVADMSENDTSFIGNYYDKPAYGTTEPTEFIGEGAVYNKLTSDSSAIESITVGIGGANKKLAELPPKGVAGGDLSGMYPNPNVKDNSHSHTWANISDARVDFPVSDEYYGATSIKLRGSFMEFLNLVPGLTGITTEPMIMSRGVSSKELDYEIATVKWVGRSFDGTQAQWDALSANEKAKYKTIFLT